MLWYFTCSVCILFWFRNFKVSYASIFIGSSKGSSFWPWWRTMYHYNFVWLSYVCWAHCYGESSQMGGSGIMLTIWILMDCIWSSLSSILNLTVQSILTLITLPKPSITLFLMVLSGPKNWRMLLVMQMEKWLSTPMSNGSDSILNLCGLSFFLSSSLLYKATFSCLILSLLFLSLSKLSFFDLFSSFVIPW